MKLVITVDIPKGVKIGRAKAYVKEALEIWGGQLHPDDELYYTVKVVSIKREVIATK